MVASKGSTLASACSTGSSGVRSNTLGRLMHALIHTMAAGDKQTCEAPGASVSFLQLAPPPLSRPRSLPPARACLPPRSPSHLLPMAPCLHRALVLRSDQPCRLHPSSLSDRLSCLRPHCSAAAAGAAVVTAAVTAEHVRQVVQQAGRAAGVPRCTPGVPAAAGTLRWRPAPAGTASVAGISERMP